MTKGLFILAGAIGLAAATPAAAQNAMQVCGAKYQAAKTAKSLPAGQTWPQFLAQCRGTLGKPVAAAPAPVTRPAAAPRAATAPSAAMLAMRSRQKQCGAQWKADRAAGKVPAGQTWPKYWSDCSKRLKG